jgi:hypothetical protein
MEDLWENFVHLSSYLKYAGNVSESSHLTIPSVIMGGKKKQRKSQGLGNFMVGEGKNLQRRNK